MTLPLICNTIGSFDSFMKVSWSKNLGYLGVETRYSQAPVMVITDMSFLTIAGLSGLITSYPLPFVTA